MSRLRSAGPPLHEAAADDAGATSRDRQPPLAGRSALIQWPRRIMARIAARAGVGPEIAWETGWSFALKAANTGLGFLTTVLLARLLGAEGYGIYAYAYALVMLLAMPAQSGLPNLIVRETARGLAEGTPDRVKGAWQNGYAERLVRTIKEDEVDLFEHRDYQDTYCQIGRFLDDVYMHKCIHSSLGYLTPAEFESQWQAQQVGIPTGEMTQAILITG